MKCIAVVMMALTVVALGAPSTYSVVQQNVVPQLVAPVPWASYAAAPVTYAAAAPTVVHANVVSRYVAPVAYAAGPALTYNTVDTTVVEAAPVVAHTATVVAQPAVAVVAQQEARYLAANPGSVHEAPLPGHTVSQQSLNLEAAPGTA
ncbi:adult cuticle protein 1-like [Topomyia yanbarensis]|uniref:adult cuticle protein 1-like n=1 Tax=Topomyia yanbarensis TaxID=2498891 RepID=UPI00273C3BE5|nr:adult cuticle protein 1-like [Topomyia yanbarensis]